MFHVVWVEDSEKGFCEDMSSFERLESVGLKQQIEDRLKQAILDGLLAPGEQLVEGEIAGQFGVSRSPVREAIQDLERQGYVVKRPRRGTFVTELTPHAVVEIFSLRALLEGYAASIAASVPQPETVERLRALVRQMEQSADESDFAGFSNADLEFHNLLCASTEHSRLIYLSQCLRTEMGFHVVVSRYSLPELRELVRDHWMLLDAIEAGDVTRARETVKRHIHIAGDHFVRKYFAASEQVDLAEETLTKVFWTVAEY